MDSAALTSWVMPRSSRWLALTACIGFNVWACHSPAQPVEAPGTARAPASAAPAQQPAQGAPPVNEDLPPRIQGPTSPVCRLTTERTIWPTSLRRRPGAAVALDVDAHVAATVSIPRGTVRDGAFTELRGPSGTVSGWQNGEDVTLHPTASLVFGDFMIPQSHTALQWKRADTRNDEGTLVLTFEHDEHVRVPGAVEREARCDDVQLTPGTFEARAPLGAVRYWGELASTTVPVTRSPGGPVVAELRLGPELPSFVSVHEVQGAMVRVVYYSYGELVFGWVSQAMVTRLPDEPGVGFGRGGGFGRSGRGGGHWVDRICDHALPLILWSEGEELVTIGELDAGTAFRSPLHAPDDEVPPWTTIQLKDSRWVQAVGDSALQIPSHHLQRCHSP